jgi:predicted metal-binding protein
VHDMKPIRIKDFTDREILEDIEKYRRYAVELGAEDAVGIPAEKVRVDYRVRMKCVIPKCPSYGMSAHCPPNGIKTEEMQQLVQCYKYGLLVKVMVDSSVIVGENFRGKDENGRPVPAERAVQLRNRYRDLSDIVTRIESRAFYDGHHLAVSFAAGSCKSHYCGGQECSVLKGQSCRFALRARPSMESSSLDAFRMAAEVGWEIYPIGMDCDPSNVPRGTVMGLVLIE